MGIKINVKKNKKINKKYHKIWNPILETVLSETHFIGNKSLTVHCVFYTAISLSAASFLDMWRSCPWLSSHHFWKVRKKVHFLLKRQIHLLSEFRHFICKQKQTDRCDRHIKRERFQTPANVWRLFVCEGQGRCMFGFWLRKKE